MIDYVIDIRRMLYPNEDTPDVSPVSAVCLVTFSNSYIGKFNIIVKKIRLIRIGRKQFKKTIIIHYYSANSGKDGNLFTKYTIL